MADLTPERIAILRTLLAEATPGPWHTFNSYTDTVPDHPINEIRDARGRIVAGLWPANGDTDGPLIVAMRNVLSALLDDSEENARLRERVETLQKRVAWFEAAGGVTMGTRIFQVMSERDRLRERILTTIRVLGEIASLTEGGPRGMAEAARDALLPEVNRG